MKISTELAFPESGLGVFVLLFTVLIRRKAFNSISHILMFHFGGVHSWVCVA